MCAIACLASSHGQSQLAICRYDSDKNLLICDELGVAYPIVNGIARVTPAAGQLLDATADSSK